jgi:hypothetical protein
VFSSRPGTSPPWVILTLLVVPCSGQVNPVGFGGNSVLVNQE